MVNFRSVGKRKGQRVLRDNDVETGFNEGGGLGYTRVISVLREF